MTAEAISGSWAGPDTGSIKVVPATDELQYLSSGRRSIVLFAELARHITIEKRGSTSARLTLDNQAIAEIQRPEDTFFGDQLGWLNSYADLRTDRIPEINQQTSDLLSFFGSSVLLNAAGRKSTLELLSITQDFAIMLEMSAKHFCWSPRPFMLQPKVLPIIQTPDHSSFPSGHSIEAFAMATVLDRLINPTVSGAATPGLAAKALHFRVAHRVATNRTIAGVHYPVDSAAGAVLGVALGDALWSLAKPEGTNAPRTKPFAPGRTGDWFNDPVASDFLLSGIAGFYDDLVQPDAGDQSSAPNPLWAKHWQRAESEWVSL